MKWPIVTLMIEREDDVVEARQRARTIAALVGFTVREQTQVATAVSEIARNAYGYAGGGKVEYGIDQAAGGPEFLVRLSDQGPGIRDLPAILEGRYQSPTGLGVGISGARRLVDRFDVKSSPGAGTVIALAKRLPAGREPFDGQKARVLGEAVAKARAGNAGDALREQNRDLLRSLSELAEREEEAQRLNRELAETNRGVVALYAELENQAAQLRDAGVHLEREVAARTAELAEANKRLRAEAVERERMEADLRQSQKMEAVGQLTGGIAHDFNNLLTGIVGSLDLMQKRLAKGQIGNLQRYMDAAVGSANRAAALTHRLLAFARRQPLDPRPTNANALIIGMTDLLRRTISESIDLRIAAADELWPTLCDPHQLENAILNLAINARDAMPDGGTLTIDARNGTFPLEPSVGSRQWHGQECVCISVTDDGTGMPPDVKARAFDPFFTTKPIGQGTGLGLSMIYGFARQSEGHARIESEVGQGTTITLYLPRCSDDVQSADTNAAALEVARGAGETVLIVEDEKVVRDLIVEALHELGYHALEAADGPAGLTVVQGQRRIDLLVTDVGLPGMNGRQLADYARTVRPELRVLFMTGYAENMASASGSLEQGMAMITKPFTMETITQRVRAMIEEGM